MMGIIVDDHRAADLADLAEAALDPAELVEAVGDGGIVHRQLQPDRDRGERVGDIMLARHRQIDVGDQSRLASSRPRTDASNRVPPSSAAHILGAQVGQRREAIGHHAAVADPAEHRLHFGMVDAHHRQPVEGHILDEFDEGVLGPVEAAIMFEMLGIDVGHDRDRPVEPQEAAVALVGLDHHPVGLAEPGVGAIAVDDPAVDHRRVDPAGVEHRGDHRRRGGLAVGARDRDGRLHPHQFGQHFRAADPRQAALDRGDDFGIVGADRGRADDHRGIAQIVRGLADRHRNADLAQPFDDIIFCDVRPCTL